jgi:DNA-binding NtrC family response regulator
VTEPIDSAGEAPHPEKLPATSDRDARSASTLLTWDEARRRLAEETARALRHGRSLSVVTIDLGVPGPFDREQLAAALRGALRLGDVVGWDGGAEILAILPETAETAEIPARRLLRALAPFADSARAGFAMCPGDAFDPAALYAGSQSAAAFAGPGGIARVRDAVSRWTLDGLAIVVADPAMKRLYALVERLARSDLPVLIVGESGAGKEIVASALHAWSPRNGARSIAINCAAIPEALLESELFGHERGAFSGAAAAKIGLLEAADGGTILLDEIGECPPAQQAKLLRVLETKRLTRLGAVTERPVDVRIVAATNRSLEDDVESGRFRRDLYFRLRAAVVQVPPLRERPLDVPVLARAFLAAACARLGRATPELVPATMILLARHAWPGNLRELKNTAEYVAATVDGATVEPRHLPEEMARSAPPWVAIAATGATAPRADPAAAPRFRSIYDEIGELEKTRMLEGLAASGGARARAAEMIGMPLRTFVTKLKEHRIDVPRSRAPRATKRSPG